jgi:hypothetical protein
VASFDDLVTEKTITDTGLRPTWAGHVLAALSHADEQGRVADGGLTPEELSILHCLKLRIEGRADRPEDDYLEYAGTTGLLGCALQIALADPRTAEREPEYRELVAGFDRALREYRRRTANVAAPAEGG